MAPSANDVVLVTWYVLWTRCRGPVPSPPTTRSVPSSKADWLRASENVAESAVAEEVRSQTS